MGRMSDIAVDNAIVERCEASVTEPVHDGWIDSCTYRNPEGFTIEYDGETGLWTASDPDGEFLDTIADTREAMIYIDTCAVYADEGHAHNFGAR